MDLKGRVCGKGCAVSVSLVMFAKNLDPELCPSVSFKYHPPPPLLTSLLLQPPIATITNSSPFLPSRVAPTSCSILHLNTHPSPHSQAKRKSFEHSTTTPSFKHPLDIFIHQHIQAATMRMPTASKDVLSERVHDSLRSFNYHARDCASCCDPYSVHLSKTLLLCDHGHALAQGAAEALYAKARTTPMGQIEVTFPEGWESVDGLIKSITHQLQGAPSNRIDLTAMKNAKTASNKTSRRIEAEREGKIVYVSAESRGSSFARDLSRRGAIEGTPVTVVSRSRPRQSRYVDPNRSSGFDLAAPAFEQPQQYVYHDRRTEAHSPRTSGRAVTFNPEVQMRYI